jgi:hypothetical protein
MDVPGVFGLSLLMVVCGVGLVHLAVRRDPVEHLLAASVVVGVALPLLFAAPVVAVALLAVSIASRRLVRPALIPNRVPRDWF